METPIPEPGAPNVVDPQAGSPTPTQASAPAAATAATAAQPAATQPAQTSTPAPAPAAAPAAQVFDATYVTALRTEAADYRVKHKEASTQLEAAAQKTAALEAQVRNLSLQTAITTAETRVADPEVALKLIDQTRLKFDANGRPENLNDLLKELVEQKPYLKAGPAVPQPTPASNPARGGAKFTLEQVKAMSTAEINANWDAVQEVLRGA